MKFTPKQAPNGQSIGRLAVLKHPWDFSKTSGQKKINEEGHSRKLISESDLLTGSFDAGSCWVGVNKKRNGKK